MAEDGIQAGKAFMEAGQKDYQSQEKLQELQLRVSMFGEAFRFVGKILKPIYDDMESRKAIEWDKLNDEYQLELDSIIDEWESKYGPGFPLTLEDLIRESRRAGMKPDTIFEASGFDMMPIIEGYRLYLQDKSRGPVDTSVDTSGKKQNKYKMNKAAWNCVKEFISERIKDPGLTVKETVRCYATEHEISFSTLYKRITDNRTEWDK